MGEVCPRLRILPFLFCSTTQGFLLFYLSLDSPSQVPLLLRYSDSLPRLSHLGPAFSFLILHSRFLRFLSDSLGQPEPIPDSNILTGILIPDSCFLIPDSSELRISAGSYVGLTLRTPEPILRVRGASHSSLKLRPRQHMLRRGSLW